MIDYTNSNILHVSAHQVGNKTNGEEVTLSKETMDITDGSLRGLLMKFFLSHFTSDELFAFTFSNNEFELNPIYTFVAETFDSKRSFHKNSKNVARQLFETALHQNIKSGDFFMAYFSNVQLNGEFTDAIGIFKSETKDVFLKLEADGDSYSFDYADGINIDKLDKGCLIFNTDRDKGFKICIIDKSNKAKEAQYWKDIFLNIKPLNDNFFFTKNALTLARDFVTNRLPDEFDVNKADQAGYLNRSMDYFKKNEYFEEKEFASAVFEDKEVIKSFKNYKKEFQNDNDVEFTADFAISAPAVKKQARNYKSVLKLDKNFHIYIHGDRSLIEQGVDDDGRRFYKIYFKEEN